jgi:hypothetical protein
MARTKRHSIKRLTLDRVLVWTSRSLDRILIANCSQVSKQVHW